MREQRNEERAVCTILPVCSKMMKEKVDHSEREHGIELGHSYIEGVSGVAVSRSGIAQIWGNVPCYGLCLRGWYYYLTPVFVLSFMLLFHTITI